MLKQASERGPAGKSLQQGHELFFKGWYKQSLWEYLQAAAAGMELGMSNAAWLLDRGYVRAGEEDDRDGLRPSRGCQNDDSDAHDDMTGVHS